MQTALSNAANWLNENRLVVNPAKSNFIILGHSSKTKNIDFNLNMNNIPVPRCTSTKLLGITIDDQLRWDEHVNNILTKVSPKLGLLRFLSQSLPPNLLATIYTSIIQPHIDYCISVWGSCNQIYISNLQKFQNRAARTACRNISESINCSDDIRCSLGWMNIQQRHFYFTSVLMFKAFNNLTSDTVCDRFSLTNVIHGYNTRFANSDTFHLPKPRTNYLKRSLSYKGANIWNKLSAHVKQSENIYIFKQSCKDFILNHVS
jgi:hypothetical protein